MVRSRGRRGRRPGGALVGGVAWRRSSEPRDLRRDNLIAGSDGRPRIVDWTHRWTAPGWADLVLLGPDLARDGLAPESGLASSVWAAAPAGDVDVMLAGLIGYWFNAGHRPALSHAPGLRELQRAQGRAAAAWLARRLGRLTTTHR